MRRLSLIRGAWSDVFVLALVAVLGMMPLACGGGGSSPTAPSPPAVPPPSVTAVSPPSGSTDGGTSLTITGTGFQSGATVSADGAATNVIVVGSTSITATTPAHGVGTVDVVVTNPGGQSGRLAGAYTYVCPLAAPTLRTSSITTGGRVLLFILWDAVPNATSYVLEVGTAPGATTFSQELAPGPSGGGAAIIGAGTNTIDLIRGTSYFIRMRAKSACGLGPFSLELQRDYV